MNDVKRKILMRLQQGPVIAVDSKFPLDGEAPNVVHQTATEMCKRGYIKVIGAPDQNSDFEGVDPDVFYLAAHRIEAQRIWNELT